MSAFAKESDLVASFCSQLQKGLRKNPWIFYHETAGFDLLLVHNETGVQVGLEAKLSLNLKVLSQALPYLNWETSGPDYRGVLVPSDKVQQNLSDIAVRLGLGVLAVAPDTKHSYPHFSLPDEDSGHSFSSDWFPWLPTERCKLPDYLPDVEGGKPSPLRLTLWKIKAIKLMILLERRGVVTRRDIKALGMSPTAWTQFGGYLKPGNGGYVKSEKTPDFRIQHPTNFAEIEADFDVWSVPIAPAQMTLGAAA